MLTMKLDISYNPNSQVKNKINQRKVFLTSISLKTIKNMNILISNLNYNDVEHVKKVYKLITEIYLYITKKH